MRLLSFAILGLLASDAAADPAIGVVETQVSAGVAGGGGQGTMSVRPAPIYVGAHAAHAVNAAPWTWLRAGVFLELGDRSAIGVEGGPRVAVGAWRAGVSAVAILAPYRLYGGGVQLGRRIGRGDAAFVPAFELRAFAGGNDLPDDHVSVAALLTIGVELDAW